MSKKIIILSFSELTRESLRAILCQDYDLVLLEPLAQNLYIIEKTKDLALFIIDPSPTPQIEPTFIQHIQSAYTEIPVFLVQSPKAPPDGLNFSPLNIKGIFKRPFQKELVLRSIHQYMA